MKNIFFAVSLVFFPTSVLHAQTSFYEGKTIRMIVGFSPGARDVVTQPPEVIERMKQLLELTK